jgi:hypothetical protein
MAELTGRPGFSPPKNQKTLSRRRAVELMATAGLTISLVVAATAVSLANRSLAHGALMDHVDRPRALKAPQ